MNAAPLAAAGLFLGGSLLVVLARLEPHGERRRLARRIALAQAHLDDAPAAPSRAPRRARLDELAMRIFGVGLDQTWGVKSSGAALFGLALLGVLAAVIAGGVLLRAPAPGVLAMALVAGFAAPRLLLSIEQRRAEVAFLENFPSAVDMIIRMLRAGLPVSAAIRAVADEAPGAVGQAFRTLGDQIQIGVSLGEALALAAKRIRLTDFRFFCASVALQQATGGNLANTLETLSEIIRKRRAMRLKAKALTSEVRMSSYVLAAIPLLVLGALMFLSPAYLWPLLHDPRGRLILGAAGLGLGLGFLTMRQMMNRAIAV